MKDRLVITTGFFALILGVLAYSGPATAQINTFTDFVSFDEATGPLTEIDFENLHSLTQEGITFRDPLDLSTAFCSSPTCITDPENPFGSGNIVLSLNSGGTIDFPPGTDRAILDIQGMGSASFTVEVTDFAGGTFTTNGQGIPFDQILLDLTTPDGISRIDLLSTSGGPLVLAAVETFDANDNLLSEIIFEDLPSNASCILSVCTQTGPIGPIVPNPLTLDGVTFTDPFDLGEGFCSSPTCQIDPDNPLGNIVLFLNSGSTIDFPPGTGGALLDIQGMGSASFTVEVTDFAGGTLTTNSQGIPFDVSFLGFTAPDGISRIEILNTSGGPLVLAAAFFDEFPSSAAITVDIKPGSDPNSINLKSKGVIPLAILGSDGFDVNDVNVGTVTFGPDGAPPVHEGGHLEDVNGDNHTDLVLHFNTQDTGINEGDTDATLTGETTDGTPIEGSDSVRIVSGSGKGKSK